MHISLDGQLKPLIVIEPIEKFCSNQVISVVHEALIEIASTYATKYKAKMFSKDISRRKRASCLAFHILTNRVIYLDTSTMGKGFTIASKTIRFPSTSKLEQSVQKELVATITIFCWNPEQ